MTVIATDGKTMAADGITVSGWSIIRTDAVKIHRAPDGCVFGTTGHASDNQKFADFIISGHYPEKLHEDFSALVLTPEGKIFHYSSDCMPLALSPPQAIGCGADVAIGALKAGAGPRLAVEITGQTSTHCGGSITELKPKNKPKKKTKNRKGETQWKTLVKQ